MILVYTPTDDFSRRQQTMKQFLAILFSLTLTATVAQGQEEQRTLGTIDDGPDL